MSLFGHNQPSASNEPASAGEAPPVSGPETVTLETLQESAHSLASTPEGFDPSRHAMNADGTPKLRGDGSYALKRGRKPGQKSAGGLIATTAGTVDKLSNDEAARQLCNAAIGMAVAVIGPEWAPKDKRESDGLVLSVKNYFDAKGQVNLPPEAGLAVAVLAYAGSRFVEHQNTRDKAEAFALRIAQGARKAWTFLRVKFGTLI